jgi:hypothetical protein
VYLILNDIVSNRQKQSEADFSATPRLGPLPTLVSEQPEKDADDACENPATAEEQDGTQNDRPNPLRITGGEQTDHQTDDPEKHGVVPQQDDTHDDQIDCDHVAWSLWRLLAPDDALRDGLEVVARDVAGREELHDLGLEQRSDDHDDQGSDSRLGSEREREERQHESDDRSLTGPREEVAEKPVEARHDEGEQEDTSDDCAHSFFFSFRLMTRCQKRMPPFLVPLLVPTAAMRYRADLVSNPRSVCPSSQVSAQHLHMHGT